jgi:hypothetical protein
MGQLKVTLVSIFNRGVQSGPSTGEQAQAWENALVGGTGKIKVTIPPGTVVVDVVNHVGIKNTSPIECDVESR